MARCKGVTKAGAKCRRTPLNGLEYCAAHVSQEIAPPQARPNPSDRDNGAEPEQLKALPGPVLGELAELHDMGIGLPRAIRLQGARVVADWCGDRFEEIDRLDAELAAKEEADEAAAEAEAAG